MSTRHYQVVENFAARKTTGLRGSNVFADKNKIYSYGHHFIMAIALDDKKLFILNGDTYSPTTSGHQSMVRAACKQTDWDNIILPFSAVDAAILSITGSRGRDWERIFSSLKIIEQGEEIDIYSCPTCDIEFANSDEAITHSEDWRKEGIYTNHYSYRHLLASSVFSLIIEWSTYDYSSNSISSHKRIEYFLSGFDETARAWNGGYFLSRLPKKPSSLAHAYEMLKPQAVRDAIKKGLNVRRQGDIFAVEDTRMTTRKLNRIATRLPETEMKPLIGWNNEVLGYEKTDIPVNAEDSVFLHEGRRPRLYGTSHVATEAYSIETYSVMNGNKTLYARGNLYHRPNRWGNEPEHRTIKLGKNWHRIFRNTALGSWSVSGRVD